MSQNEKNFKNRNNKNNLNKVERPKNIELNVPILFGKAVNNQEYSDNSAINALVHLNDQILPYINIPLSASRAKVTGDDSKKGVTSIGFVSSYDKDNNTMKVVVYNRYQELINSMKAENDLGLAIRCVAKDNNLTRFVGFELV